jgi:DNA repair protein RadA/Sms
VKIRTQYVCQSCGYSASKWLGKCPGCEGWNTLVEERTAPQSSRNAALEAAGLHGALLTSGREPWVGLDHEAGDDGDGASTSKTREQSRLMTGISELDRVLGGGLVPDSFVLLGGDPGIGKSTLLLQMARGLLHEGSKNEDLKILYVSGEESVDQIRGRAHRMGVEGKGRIFLAAETLLENVFATIKELKPHIILMDSLQTFSSGMLESAPGSVSQVREVATRLMALAKSSGVCIWLVGHVTKDGNIAGPKVVEHMVDTVLYFEAEAGQSYRLLRTVKNRFGSSRELGVFEMDGEGLREVLNPSSLFLADRKEPVSGTAVSASLEGTRPILAELQALVAPSGLSVPRRTAVGMDSARVSLIAAILERHMRLSLAQHDLFFNVAGGLRLSEPACDLAAAAAIWSSTMDHPVPNGWIFIGELGLTGEVRRVSQLEARIDEAKKLGFKTVVIPRVSSEKMSDQLKKYSDLKLVSLARIEELPKLFT